LDYRNNVEKYLNVVPLVVSSTVVPSNRPIFRCGPNRQQHHRSDFFTAQIGAIGRNSAQKGAIRRKWRKWRKRAQLGANGRNSAQKGTIRRIMALFKNENHTWTLASSHAEHMMGLYKNISI
jgi:hypothetical protein